MTIGIYKLTHKTQNDKFYIGSSKDIKARKYKHKSKSNPDCPTTCKLYQVIQQDGWDNYELEILEEYDQYDSCTIKHQEQIYISDMKPTLNTRAAYLTEEQKKQLNRIASAKKNKIVATCECGCMVRKAHIARHRKTYKHKLKMFDINVAKTVQSCIGLDLDPLIVLGNILVNNSANTSTHTPAYATFPTATVLNTGNDDPNATQNANN